MQRKNYYLSDGQLRNLDIEASGLGIPVSEVLRRIIDVHYTQHPVSYIDIGVAMFSGATSFSGIGVLPYQVPQIKITGE